jgi:hypothetical protein
VSGHESWLNKHPENCIGSSRRGDLMSPAITRWRNKNRERYNSYMAAYRQEQRRAAVE